MKIALAITAAVLAACAPPTRGCGYADYGICEALEWHYDAAAALAGCTDPDTETKMQCYADAIGFADVDDYKAPFTCDIRHFFGDL